MHLTKMLFSVTWKKIKKLKTMLVYSAHCWNQMKIDEYFWYFFKKQMEKSV